MTIHHGDCGHIKLHWDNHKECINCSHCFRESTCSTCSSWPNSVWNLAENRRTYSSRKKAMSSRKKSQNPSVSSNERKKKHGSTAPHGITGRGKTHIGGNSLGTCTQGSTSPPTTGHQSPVIPQPTHQPLANRPMDKKTYLVDWACPVTGHWACPVSRHQPLGIRPMDKKTYLADQACPVTGHARSPGMPSQRAPATGHSPTTGQTGNIETSSLPITGHQPFSHRLLELERLNPAEIKESSATGHDQSPGSRPQSPGIRI